MIPTHVYACGQGCRRQTAMDLTKTACSAHDLTWQRVPDSRVDFRTAADPPGTPLSRAVLDDEEG